VHRNQRAEGGLAALDLLADERLGDVVEPRSAVLDRDHRAQQAQLGHALDDAHVEVVVDVVLLRDRHDATINELADRLLDRELLVGQIEVQDHSLDACGKSVGS
jgi:DNA-directed RNA polymerase sigma subunit (sigma70/sigma32)